MCSSGKEEKLSRGLVRLADSQSVLLRCRGEIWFLLDLEFKGLPDFLDEVLLHPSAKGFPSTLSMEGFVFQIARVSNVEEGHDRYHPGYN